MVHRPIGSIWRYRTSLNEVEVIANTGVNYNTIRYTRIIQGGHRVGHVYTNRPLDDFDATLVQPPAVPDGPEPSTRYVRVWIRPNGRSPLIGGTVYNTYEDASSNFEAVQTTLSLGQYTECHLVPLRSVMKITATAIEDYREVPDVHGR